MKYLFYLIAILISCSNRKPTPEGGPCSYEVTRYPAVIILIDSLPENSYNLFLKVNQYGTADTLSYTLVNHQQLQKADLAGLRIGDSIYYEHHQITSGACNPDIFRFSLKKE